MTKRLVLWGTYDLGKPRTRIMRKALCDAGFELFEVHAPIWEGIEDKSQLTILGWIKCTIRWLFAYPNLIWKYLRAPEHDAVVVPYMGHLDVLVVWSFTKLRGKRLIWDAFLSLYDTVVRDRKIINRANPLAFLLHFCEWFSCQAADRIVLDTAAHAALFRELYGLDEDRTAAIFVGAESENFVLSTTIQPNFDAPLQVLFYGQFIPLHGIEIIARAAILAKDLPIEWHLIGNGQEAPKIRALFDGETLPRLRWTDWVPYEALKSEMEKADICLGVFGTSEKAARVIPNKVFQILASGKPLVTRDSPAIRELVQDSDKGVVLIAPGEAQALVSALVDFDQVSASSTLMISQRYSPKVLASSWKKLIEAVAPDKLT